MRSRVEFIDYENAILFVDAFVEHEKQSYFDG
jgi:hypothetical protein